MPFSRPRNVKSGAMLIWIVFSKRWQSTGWLSMAFVMTLGWYTPRAERLSRVKVSQEREGEKKRNEAHQSSTRGWTALRPSATMQTTIFFHPSGPQVADFLRLQSCAMFSAERGECQQVSSSRGTVACVTHSSRRAMSGRKAPRPRCTS